MGSSIASNEITALQKVFHVPDGPETILPATTFLIGFVLGPLVFAPLSEQYGRRPILISTLCLYIIFSMACALAPNWAAFLIFRFFSGTFASPPMSVTGGSIADVFDEKVSRGKANVWWSTGTLLGPLAGPVASGYLYPYSWRWGFWVCMILSAVSLVALIVQPETLATKILRDRAAKLNKEKGSVSYIAPADHDRPGIITTLVSNCCQLEYCVRHRVNANLENHHNETSAPALYRNVGRAYMRLYGFRIRRLLYAARDLPRDIRRHLRIHSRRVWTCFCHDVHRVYHYCGSRTHVRPICPWCCPQASQQTTRVSPPTIGLRRRSVVCDFSFLAWMDVKVIRSVDCASTLDDTVRCRVSVNFHVHDQL